MSAIDTEARRLRAALGRLAEVKGDGGECPTAATLWDSAAEHLASRENRAVILHLGECTACAVAWELARDLTPAEEAAAVETRSPGWNWMPLAAAAALIVAATGLWMFGPWTSDAPAPVLRDQAGDWLVSETPETRALARDALVLRWAAGPEGTLYDLNVTNENLDPLLRRRGLEQAQYTIDAGDLDGVAAGSPILWRVTAHLPDGQKVSSRTFSTDVE